MKWLIGVVIISLIQLNRISSASNEILNTPDCASGESAWCESLGSAVDCKATEHCFQNVWSKDWQLVGKDKNCVMCHKMMDEVKSTLQVDGNSATDVVALIDNEKVCSMAQLCAVEESSEQGDEYVLAKKKAQKKVTKQANKLKIWGTRAPYCNLCHSVFQVIADFIDHNHGIIQNILKVLCGLLGRGFGRTCDKYAANYGPIGISIISTYLHHQICSTIHLCASHHHAAINVFAQTSNKPNQISNLECAACNDAMTLIHKALSEENVVEDFKNFVTAECMKYETQEAECIALLHSQADALHGLLLKDLSENDRCSKNCLSSQTE